MRKKGNTGIYSYPIRTPGSRYFSITKNAGISQPMMGLGNGVLSGVSKMGHF